MAEHEALENTCHFIVVCSVTWYMNASGPGGDLALIKTSLIFSIKCHSLALKQLDLHNNGSHVCIKTRSPNLAAIQRAGH